MASERPAAKRRRLEAPSAPHEDGRRNLLETIDDVLAPTGEEHSDTMAALLLLRNEFPASAKVVPILLRSQIYDIVKDRTVVDRSLEQERERGQLRVIKLPASVDDYAYVLKADYDSCIETAQQEQQEKGLDSSRLQVFALFQAVLPRYSAAGIPHSKLISLLGKSRSPSSQVLKTLTDSELAPLLASGLLTREVGDQTRYLFAVPSAGPFIASVTKGRKEILGLLARKRYKEAFAKDMHRWKLRGSCLDMRWHLRDLTGRGNVQVANTPSGQLVRLVKKT